jgi:acyl-CoA reductase-like NAD-dependent aldehyde dehydrogenase
MSTDLVVVVEAAAADFRDALRKALQTFKSSTYPVMTKASSEHIGALVKDAICKGAEVSVCEKDIPEGEVTATVLDPVSSGMRFAHEESFGPLLGLCVVRDEADAVALVNDSGYGLSAAIWTRCHMRAIQMAQQLNVGAVHVNASTVHDESTLPHGGRGLSGFGRFGGQWGLREFVQTKTIILHQ